MLFFNIVNFEDAKDIFFSKKMVQKTQLYLQSSVFFYVSQNFKFFSNQIKNFKKFLTDFLFPCMSIKPDLIQKQSSAVFFKV